MPNEIYPIKHKRLQQLHEAGFNIADFICFPPRTLAGRTEELRAFLVKHGKISCRHFHEDEKRHFKCPVLYDQTDIDAVLAFCLEHNQIYYTLCNEAICLKDSVCAGNVLILDERNYFIEYFFGQGTPRDIETKNADELKVYTRAFGVPPSGDEPLEIIKRLAFEASKFHPIRGPYIIEFSVYPYPIGINQTTVVVWEWRLGWLHYQLQANKSLIEENKRLSESIKRFRGRIRELENESWDMKTGGFWGRLP